VSSCNSFTPTGDLGAWRVTGPSPIDLASVEHVVSTASIAEPWKRVRANTGAPGVERISIECFPKWGRPRWKQTKRQLLEGSYVLACRNLPILAVFHVPGLWLLNEMKKTLELIVKV